MSFSCRSGASSRCARLQQKCLGRALGWIVFSKETEVQGPDRPFGRKKTNVVPQYSSAVRGFAWALLALVFIGAIVGGVSVVKHRQALEEKLVVMIAAFEGPEEVYGIRNEMIEILNADFSNDEDIEIIALPEIVSPSSGSNYARKLGERYSADIVIWGWYRPTENPNITIHIEYLDSKQLLPSDKRETFRPKTTLAELESFDFQPQVRNETSALISSLAGFIDYRDGIYEEAIEHFNQALDNLSAESRLIEIYAETYSNRGRAYYFLEEYQYALQDFDEAIQINPRYADAYKDRGVVYLIIGKNVEAGVDFKKYEELTGQDAP